MSKMFYIVCAKNNFLKKSAEDGNVRKVAVQSFSFEPTHPEDIGYLRGTCFHILLLQIRTRADSNPTQYQVMRPRHTIYLEVSLLKILVDFNEK